MSEADLGGDPPCWAHMLDEEFGRETSGSIGAVVVDLGVAAIDGGGAIWSLPHGGDLDANLVRLNPHGGIGAHVNDDVDVLLYVQSGSGTVTIEGVAHEIGPDHVALIPRGTNRSVTAGPAGVIYLSVHRRRSPLNVTGSRAGR